MRISSPFQELTDPKTAFLYYNRLYSLDVIASPLNNHNKSDGIDYLPR